MDREQPDLPGPALGGPGQVLAAGQRVDARAVQADGLEQQHGYQQVSLVTEDQPLQAGTGPCAAAGEGQHADHDVGVLALGVRVGVVPVVLADPPAVAEAGGEVAAEDAERVVGLPAGKDLPVACVVAEEADLAEDDGQEHRHAELVPRVTDEHERRPAGHERRRRQGDLGVVIRHSPVEQMRLAHLAGQLGVLTAARGGLRGDGSHRAAPGGCGRSGATLGVPSDRHATSIPRLNKRHKDHMSAPKEFPCGPGPSVLAVMTRTKVLVTSSAGHLGEVLTRVLRGRGYQVTGQDLQASPSTAVPAASVTPAPVLLAPSAENRRRS